MSSVPLPNFLCMTIDLMRKLKRVITTCFHDTLCCTSDYFLWMCSLTKVLVYAALAEASVIVREHTPLSNLFMCLWFNEVVRFTSRDQLSFPYALWRLKVLKNINMFPVCTRKDLVNSMGHIRKAKPLITSHGALV